VLREHHGSLAEDAILLQLLMRMLQLSWRKNVLVNLDGQPD